tara:strand:- start:1348 stop:1878 length:531 start_codon:yes stop_codon:yes gene_type:complete
MKNYYEKFLGKTLIYVSTDIWLDPVFYKVRGVKAHDSKAVGLLDLEVLPFESVRKVLDFDFIRDPQDHTASFGDDKLESLFESKRITISSHVHTEDWILVEEPERLYDFTIEFMCNDDPVDLLYENGCDDSLVAGGPDKWFVDFRRTGSSWPEVVQTAMSSISNAGGIFWNIEVNE